ncbi:hypothetical protein FNV43_RR23071 [Rhamnella rubrinervis]|uniref:Leucine-rich repeat-containing N-terminal plant-type domain-containing protein n=1 Tax=Rhamnella rubrinervis TaxID=2594499 RepID=A0A8K0DXT9_9ROSA|nr:hypothetical protein FNV43_RR23071 [Rhamnella rubrinervis]
MIAFVFGHDLCIMRAGVRALIFLIAVGMLVGKGGSYSPVQCLESERQALLSFKQGLEDSKPLSSWTSNSSQDDCCLWEGISCDNKTNHVVELGLSAYQLGSEISPSLLQLKYLELLDLSFNNFGRIPEFIGSLTRLTYLDLSGNPMSGTIPSQLGNLTSLSFLSLGGTSENHGTVTVSNFRWISRLSSLKHLTVLAVNFTTTSDWLQSIKIIPSLTRLDMDECQFPKVSCTNQNQLGGPVFPALEKLYLYNNLLEGPLPNSLRQFPKLLFLRLDNNFLTGPLPNLSPFLSLGGLCASNNKLDGNLPESIGQLRNLKYFDVSSNSFSGLVSEVHLMNLSRLYHMDLSFNSLTFNLSSNWLPPFQLGTLKLASCTMGPQFPNCLRTQSQRLTVLDISNSSIFGVIPSWFSNVSSNLGYLNMSFNHLSGMVPNFSLKLDDVTYPIVDLSYNQFHGAVPPLLSNASELYLSNNEFTGFRGFLCTPNDMLKVLYVLDLSDNLLSGSMPDCWVQWRRLGILNLETLRLKKNSLSGNLPSILNGSSQLLVLDVGHNSLNGKIPTWIGETLGLKLLSLKSNEFYGSIPSNLCHLDSIQILDLSLNNLSGVIPSCINNFTSMAHNKGDEDDTITSIYYPYLDPRSYENDAMLMWKGLEYKYDKILGLLRLTDLSSNRLSGQIPATLANLVELVQVNLSRNHLSGIIPMNIGELSRLESLDLSHNQLSGKIPMGLAKLSSLSYLDLSNNHLWSKIPTSTQLQSFNSSTYAGNSGLCGPTLTSTCPGDEPVSVPSNSSDGNESYVEDGEDWLDMSWFNIGIGVGFAVGFWAVCGTLAYKTSWRHAYFRLLNELGD